MTLMWKRVDQEYKKAGRDIWDICLHLYGFTIFSWTRVGEYGSCVIILNHRVWDCMD